MPFLFKLAKRLACIHKVGLVSSVVALVACADLFAPVSPPVELFISPEAVSLTPGQSLQFVSFGRTELGDSVPVTVVWSASWGRITKHGLLTADTIPGDYEVTATSDKPRLVRAAKVRIRPAPHTVSDMAAVATSDHAAELSFTEVDDGMGQPATYEVRYAVAPIDWASARAVSEGTCAAPLVGTAIGASRRCTVLGLSAATEYDFQLVALRQSAGADPVFGRPSNLATSTTADSADYWSVATVQVQPTAMGGNAGFGGQLWATLKDANGKILNGRTVVRDGIRHARPDNTTVDPSLSAELGWQNRRECHQNNPGGAHLTD